MGVRDGGASSRAAAAALDVVSRELAGRRMNICRPETAVCGRHIGDEKSWRSLPHDTRLRVVQRAAVQTSSVSSCRVCWRKLGEQQRLGEGSGGWTEDCYWPVSVCVLAILLRTCDGRLCGSSSVGRVTQVTFATQRLCRKWTQRLQRSSTFCLTSQREPVSDSDEAWSARREEFKESYCQREWLWQECCLQDLSDNSSVLGVITCAMIWQVSFNYIVCVAWRTWLSEHGWR